MLDRNEVVRRTLKTRIATAVAAGVLAALAADGVDVGQWAPWVEFGSGIVAANVVWALNTRAAKRVQEWVTPIWDPRNNEGQALVPVEDAFDPFA